MTLEEILANIEATRKQIAALAKSTAWSDAAVLKDASDMLKVLYAKRDELVPREGRRSSVARGGKNKKKEQQN